MLKSRVELLQAMPVFGALREDSLQFLLEHAKTSQVAAGQFFFREGDDASSMFVLESGRVTVLKSWNSRDITLRTLGPGDCFGEMALMDMFPRSASVRADEECQAIELSPGALLRLFARDGEQFAMIQMNMGREVCRRLRQADALLFRARMGDEGATDSSSVFEAT